LLHELTTNSEKRTEAEALSAVLQQSLERVARSCLTLLVYRMLDLCKIALYRVVID
jgi:hypothetical protein